MKETAWIDIDFNEYTMDEITDRYLLNIIKFMAKGGGYNDFLTYEKRQDLVDEAIRRGLIKDSVDSELSGVAVTDSQIQELFESWSSIGMNDCNPPSAEVTDLFKRLVAHVADSSQKVLVKEVASQWSI